MCPKPRRRQVMLTQEGPVLAHGPMEMILPDGRRMSSDRVVSALWSSASRPAPYWPTGAPRCCRKGPRNGPRCAIPFPAPELVLRPRSVIGGGWRFGRRTVPACTLRHDHRAVPRPGKETVPKGRSRWPNS